MASENINEIKAKLNAANKAVLKIEQHMSGSGGSGGDSSGGSAEKNPFVSIIQRCRSIFSSVIYSLGTFDVGFFHSLAD